MELTIEKSIKTDEFDEIIEKAIRTALSEEKIEEECEISVTLCSNEEIAALNEEYMKREGPTDVLSFPMLSFDEDRKIIPESMVYDGELLVLGDIVISVEKAESQAAQFGHSLMREVGFLTVHSMLHLLGYDHMKEDEREIMQGKEKIILNEMNLPREFAEEEK